MRRPSYAVVSYTLVTLSVFGFMVDKLRGQIPEPEPNRLRFESQEFLVQGARSRVDWRTLSPAIFAEARRSGKPIMLMIGAPWSRIARGADAFVFTDKDVVSFLNRYVICVRIDAQAEPKWLGAFLPLRRLRLPMTIGCQIWFLTPEGEVFENGAESGTLVAQDAANFNTLLVRVREKLRLIRSGGPEAPVPGEEQRNDYEALTDPSFPVALNFADLDREIATSDGLSLGGIVKVNRVRSLPNAVQYLLMTGQREAAAKAVVSLLRSPLIDWLDGGIYRSYVPTRPISLEFDKSALMNAEWMGVLAKSGDLLPDETVLQFSQGIFDMLAGSFTQGGFVVGCQVGDETFRGRSTRNSFSPKALRDLLTPEERQIARDKLGLRVEDHQIMTVWAQDPRLAYDVESGVPKVLQKLREGRAGQPQFAGRRQLDIHGYVVARMLEAARVWDDESRLLIADDLFSRLDWFLVGDDVQHTLEAGNPNEPYLGDYLAYADACLQHYLAFGRVDSITKGIKVLKRSRILFEFEVPGVWRAGIRSQNVLSPKNSDCPELIDMLRESLTAYAIRLCNTYGRLIRDLQAPSDQQQSDAILLLQTAQSTVSQNSAISRALGLDGAAYFCSALKVSDDRHAVVVGPGAVTKAARLWRRVPRRLVAPALGPVRPLLQKRAAGIYLIVGTQETGPVSEDEAVRALSVPFRP